MSKKQEIISIATGIIHSKGYQATSISDILQAASIGKGQFYHYFSSKYDLGLAVIENIIQEWDHQLILNILQLSESPKIKLNKMLDWIITYHGGREDIPGCPIGNLAIEMSEHDETFQLKIQDFFNRWIQEVEKCLEEIVKQNQLDSTVDSLKNAQAIVAMIEGGILLMKSQQNVSILTNVIEAVRKQYHLL
ncbi:TetR/AcrR family transcriptional regulator [Niallia sp. Krafla_26]|uniref:TetR/AcrR family transcriptional regulator n=1 Tax=Niallia sp. Krafla_26 TaxID=3064703 RepID=UPI003D177459